MILYALEAKDNCGKSTTLKKLLLHLLESGAAPLTDVSKSQLKGQLLAERRARISGEEYETQDITAILDVAGTKVGIATDGSTPEATGDAVNFFRDSGCKVCFFAVRSKGAVQAMLNEYARYNTVYRVEKAVLFGAEQFPDCNRYIEELNAWQASRLYDFCRSELNA